MRGLFLTSILHPFSMCEAENRILNSCLYYLLKNPGDVQ
jgi:hypothetical protein